MDVGVGGTSDLPRRQHIVDIILVATSNKVVAEKMKDREYRTARKLKAFVGMVMIGLGVFIIVECIFIGI